MPGCPNGGLLSGTAGRDKLYGGDGEDEVRGLGATDEVYRGLDKDVVYGGPGKDIVSGSTIAVIEAGRDKSDGGPGNDFIEVQGAGRAKIYCGEGEDFYVANEDDHVSSSCEEEAEVTVMHWKVRRSTTQPPDRHEGQQRGTEAYPSFGPLVVRTSENRLSVKFREGLHRTAHKYVRASEDLGQPQLQGSITGQDAEPYLRAVCTLSNTRTRTRRRINGFPKTCSDLGRRPVGCGPRIGASAKPDDSPTYSGSTSASVPLQQGARIAHRCTVNVEPALLP